jgi:hypothetical protein
MPKTETFDAAYWRGRAEEARKVAAQMPDPRCQESMWDVAKIYDGMANSAEMQKQPTSKGAASWAADIFEAETSRLMHMVSFPTYDELRGWLAALVAERPDSNFRASFAIPADAPDGHREELQALKFAPPALT